MRAVQRAKTTVFANTGEQDALERRSMERMLWARSGERMLVCLRWKERERERERTREREREWL